ncbi:protein kinase [Chloracidobacterium sp. D]|uniref:serine/threonine-protein kinase n=1 Tax=Chloracidobacterium sp. D TaxID=2821536 RepID=UPI001B8D18D8|nr:serine/threonine-protein kinase [Chloracidobacterium sp. D]QUV83329.1 protein kinase [Chloracidobacterium sp. D]
MTPEQYQRVTEIFNQIIESPSDQHSGLLSALCAGDDTLRREVESLLRVHPSAQSFIEEPFRASGLEDLEDLPTEQAVLQTQSFFHLDTGQQARGTSVSDRYVVERELGRGGNGIVYLARDQQLHGRLVVVKVLLENQQSEPLAQRLFESESEALARISHPGVVKVLDCGRLLSGQSYFVMEYVRGETLRAVMQRRRLSVSEVAGVVSQIGRALSAAHREGVYHRDLKPENVMLEDLGDEALHVKLIDFGIAKVANSAVKQDGPDGLVGTLPYMAPEQILASGCSAATDIYALGIIAYELLAGERPYKPAQSNLRSAIQSMTTLQRAGFGQHLRQRRPDLDEEVEQVLRKALAYDAGQRYASAEDFVQAFLPALELSAKQEASLRAVEEEPTISLSNLPPAGGEAATLAEPAIPTSTTTAEPSPPDPYPTGTGAGAHGRDGRRSGAADRGRQRPAVVVGGTDQRQSDGRRQRPAIAGAAGSRQRADLQHRTRDARQSAAGCRLPAPGGGRPAGQGHRLSPDAAPVRLPLPFRTFQRLVVGVPCPG